jgi:lipopolysaccharide transport system ATP-binding protein
MIQVRDLGKRYRLGGAVQLDQTLPEAVSHAARRLFGRGDRERPGSDRSFWALRGVNFDVQRGEVLGIIGRNGAGKSTLLKILSEITEPSEGYAAIRGRIASLLEVGTGFHPELTGRENIYLNGSILGMTQREIRGKFDEIVAFSGVEKFLDTPIKRYSSGMTVRLAFAVAAHLEPEILVIDEVLAVGDAEFQRKCMGKMQEVAREGGRTVLFVSHNMSAVNMLCHRAMLLDAGMVAQIGPSNEITARYLDLNACRAGERMWNDGDQQATDQPMQIRRVALRTQAGLATAELDLRRPHTLEIEYEIREPLPCMRGGFWIAANDGTIVMSSYDADVEAHVGPRSPGMYVTRCLLPGNLLNVGDYRLTLHGGIPGVRPLYLLENVLAFAVHETGGAGALVGGKRRGLVRPLLDWEVRKVA